MSVPRTHHWSLEKVLAAFLQYSTWLASAVIGIGLTVASIDPDSMQIATIGIALFILLPTLRVLLMLVAFLLERRLVLAGNAVFVLAVLALSFYFSIR